MICIVQPVLYCNCTTGTCLSFSSVRYSTSSSRGSVISYCLVSSRLVWPGLVSLVFFIAILYSTIYIHQILLCFALLCFFLHFQLSAPAAAHSSGFNVNISVGVGVGVGVVVWCVVCDTCCYCNNQPVNLRAAAIIHVCTVPYPTQYTVQYS